MRSGLTEISSDRTLVAFEPKRVTGHRLSIIGLSRQVSGRIGKHRALSDPLGYKSKATRPSKSQIDL